MKTTQTVLQVKDTATQGGLYGVVVFSILAQGLSIGHVTRWAVARDR